MVDRVVSLETSMVVILVSYWNGQELGGWFGLAVCKSTGGTHSFYRLGALTVLPHVHCLHSPHTACDNSFSFVNNLRKRIRVCQKRKSQLIESLHPSPSI